MTPNIDLSATRSSPSNILFVDDDQNILDSLSLCLHHKFNITYSNDPLKELEFIKTNNIYQVIFSDLKMPGLNGIEFFEAIKKISPETIRILFTGYGDINIAIKAINDNEIFKFLTKPFSNNIIHNTILDSLDKYMINTLITTQYTRHGAKYKINIHNLNSIFFFLTPTERRIAHLINNNFLPYEIASLLNISINKTQVYINKLLNKIKIHSIDHLKNNDDNNSLKKNHSNENKCNILTNSEIDFLLR